MWPLHDRLESRVTEETCKAETESFARHGQLLPALGRELRGDPDYDIELIYGARRLFVARQLNKPLLVEVRAIADREAIVAMDIENRQRLDISPYERALSYARWLRGGHFRSQDDLARSLNVSSSQVSRLLKLARMPSAIVAAFGNPTEICEGWGLELIDVLDDPQRRQATLDRARLIGAREKRPPARDVYRQLLTATVRRRRVPSSALDEVVKDTNGTPLFRIRHQTNAIAVVIPLQTVKAGALERIRTALVGILHAANAQTLDFKPPRPLIQRSSGL
jgi:ParB family chromosome partitioning protein